MSDFYGDADSPDDVNDVPSGDEMRATMRREGFYESAYKMLNAEFDDAVRQLTRMRTELANANDELRRAKYRMQGWKDLAIRYGAELHTDVSERKDCIEGRIALAAPLVRMGGEDAVMMACAQLAKKMVLTTGSR